MRLVIDTNVIVSAIFWAGIPSKVLQAVLDGIVDIILTREIVEEYECVLLSLACKASTSTSISVSEVLDSLKTRAVWCRAMVLPERICQDKDDDKFIAAAIASQSPIIVSGDKLLLRCSGYSNIEIIQPQHFVERYL